MARQFGTRITLEVMEQRLQGMPIAPSPSSSRSEVADNKLTVRSIRGLKATPVAPPVVSWESDDTDARLIRDWLSELQMLKGVPFHYLVPDMAMLPDESLRFFQVDKGWLAALLDGAFSIGGTTIDSLAAQKACDSLRAAAEGAVQRCETRQALQAEAVPETQCQTVATTGTLSGFLLRSNLLGAWPGLEVQGFTDTGALSIVRMELLAPGLLLCLFNDRLTRVLFKLPAEASHFGVRDAANKGFDKALRTLGNDPGNPTELKAEVSTRSNGRRVIPLARLAASMSKALDAPLDAAGFALQMVEGADAVAFTWSRS
ncbi:hypothetical protein NLK61_24645 [Pseudomonas fuscovaginae UPB0736]|uniref:Uncharacterized protein n=1 Tax=Pseudomonas asplenii TaxID=53407 RepID=A0A1H6NYX0_9PSED|nr:MULTISPECIES: hypothetical protein [Pseudomonas]UUQ64368.1 hypothetical protein NLK61_24645 [Pseudomonas fuscovaginae UPB0736]UZE27138.1 hypothetical protein LOY63_17320 [Pseudomonas asplenii]SEI22307.1 hypothetical protein SAMN05216581_4775 [Pseudomonas fuscovaginae]